MANQNIPVLTLEQRHAALAKAKESRTVRAKAKEDLKAGKLSIADLLATDDPVLKRMPVSGALRALPSVGAVKCERIMQECGISEKRRIGGLGRSQKAALIDRFGD